MEKTQKRIDFLTEWIEELAKKKDFDSQNQVFVLQQELDSRTMYLNTLKQDADIKRMNVELPLMVEQIDKEKLSIQDREKLIGLKKRVKNDRYINVGHKANDFRLAQQLLS